MPPHHLKIDWPSGVVERDRSGPTLAAVLVVQDRLAAKGHPQLEVRVVDLQTHPVLRGARRNDLLRRLAELGQVRRGIGWVKTGLREGVLVEVEDLARGVEGHRPLRPVDLEVVDHRGDEVTEREVVGCDGRGGRHDALAVDQELDQLALPLHDVRQLRGSGQCGRVRGLRVLVAVLGDQADVDVALR